MTLEKLLETLDTAPDTLQFDDTLAVIDGCYHFSPTGFANGEVQNAPGENNGSCKILAFGLAQGLTPAQTLACFGRFYREDVLRHPEGEHHQNIRNFIKTGWKGVRFDGQPLTERGPDRPAQKDPL